MTTQRWAIAFLQLGLLLLAVGALPALVMGILAPTSNALLPMLLSLTVAPLGALVILTGAVLWVAGRLQR